MRARHVLGHSSCSIPDAVENERLIRGFLVSEAGRFCDDCLSGSLGLPGDGMDIAVKVAIRGQGHRFTREYGRCAACGQLRIVTRKHLAA
jgi:hypothetical protein